MERASQSSNAHNHGHVRSRGRVRTRAHTRDGGNRDGALELLEQQLLQQRGLWQLLAQLEIFFKHNQQYFYLWRLL